MTANNEFKSSVCDHPWITPGIILATALLAHGLLLISDFIMWDGWMLEEWLTSAHWDFLQRACFEGGQPLLFYFHRIFANFPNPDYAYKVIAFLCITFSALLTFKILNQTGFVNRMEALLITLFGLTFPAFRVAGESSTSQYLFCYLLFLGAACLAFEAETRKDWRRICLRVGALVAFFLSFHMGSLLVFYFGFFMALLLCEQRRRGQRLFFIPWTWLMRRIDYIILPFIFWGWRCLFTPTHGFYKGYNMPSMSVYRLLIGFKTLVYNALVPSIEEGISPFLWTHPITIILAVLGFYVLSRFVYLPPQAVFSPETRTKGLFGFGLVLLFLGTFPYMAVRAVFGSYGWETRTALLIALPASILLVAVLRLFFYDLGARRSRWLFPVIVLMLCGFTANYVKTYVSWQAVSAKDHSVIFNLSKMEGAADYSVVEVRNEFRIPETVDYYGVMHWTYQLRYAFDNMKWLAFETRPGASIQFGGPPRGSHIYTEQELLDMVVSTLHPYVLAEINISGRQGILTIRRGTESGSIFKLAMKYWFYKMFRREKMNLFLSRVTSLELKPR